jgi:hypothetical protein
VTEMRKKKTKLEHDEVHSHELGAMVGLNIQSFQGMGDISVQIHGKVGQSMGTTTRSQEFNT